MTAGGASASELPTGTVTFVFTDIEGSTRLLSEIGSERFAERLMEHRRLVRAAVDAHGGVEVGTRGDSFFVVFLDARDALAAAGEIQHGLRQAKIRVRMGIHTGQPLVSGGDYVGLDVHKAARISAAAHGGQVLVSQTTRDDAGVELRDLGEHRLKDLSAPERLFQLGDGDFPPLRTLFHTNLPVQPTPLFGRQAEMAELVGLAESHRLLTITGLGGMGKTRLALELAGALADKHPDGVWWVPLAAITDAHLVMPAITSALDVSGDLTEYLAQRRLLLLLDNLEQVLDAGPYIAELLSAAPGVHVLATSRERLGLAAEQEFPLSPLSEPGAAELFVTRARQVKPDFQPDATIAEICRRLDRWPLALELASTRVKLMSTAQMLSRLSRRFDLLAAGRRDVPKRQSTMRATLDWSYELLSAVEQRVFRGLSVFVGSFELDAAEAVAQAGLDELQSLVDKSLVRQDSGGRFFFLETTREYALERLHDASEAAAARRRHGEWFVAFALDAAEGMRSPQQREWLRRVRAHTPNFRAALQWTLEEDVAAGIRLAGILSGPWRMWGHLTELLSWLQEAVARTRTMDVRTRAEALREYGSALFFTEKYVASAPALEESLELWRSLGDLHEEATTLRLLGSTASAQGDRVRARTLHECALEIYQREDDRHGMERTMHVLGELLRDGGDLSGGAALLEQAVQLSADAGDHQAMMASLHSLGDLALDAGDRDRAAQRFGEALQLASYHDDERSQGYCLAGLACAAAMAGDAEAAGRLWGQAEAIEDRLSARMLDFERTRYERILGPLASDPAFRSAAEAARQAG